MYRVGSVSMFRIRRSCGVPVAASVSSLLIVAWAASPAAGQVWTEEAKLKASDSRRDSFFGASLSVDRGRVLVGAPPDDRVGAAYIIELTETGPVEVTILKAGDSERDNDDAFGWSVALDGDRALIGAPDDEHVGGVGEGSAFIFERTADGWTTTAKLIASSASTSYNFGFSVALDGDRALVGAPVDDHSGAVDAGSVYVFELSGDTWEEVARLTAFDFLDGDLFGYSVALDGDRALVGAVSSDGGAPDSGSAYIFEHFGGIWLEIDKLVPSDPRRDDQFAFSVALEGDRAVIGANWDDHAGGVSAGSAYVFEFSNFGFGQSGWTEVARLSASDAAAEDNFGVSVALEGDRIIVGAPTDDHTVDDRTAFDSGSAYVFELSAGRWTEVAKLVASDLFFDTAFGNSVALDGDRAFAGALYEGFGAGATYVFTTGGGDDAPLFPSFVRGDTNADGTRNLSDAVSTLISLFQGGAPPSCMKSADVNDDSTVNLTDAIHLLSFLFNAGAAPFAPFPECGTDPTEDALTCESFAACDA